MIIEVNVSNKIAKLKDRSIVGVCDNSDYVIHFNFDDEWNTYATMEDKPRTIRQGKKIEQGKVIDGKCGFYITKKGKATAERIKREEEKARKAQEREAAKPQIDLELVKELHQQGLPNREILERTGYSRHYLEKALKELGLHANRLVSWRHKQMLRLYQDGALDAEIAEAVGIGRRSVTEWRYRHALPSNWRREKKQE